MKESKYARYFLTEPALRNKPKIKMSPKCLLTNSLKVSHFP
jgi:hypothetical protein